MLLALILIGTGAAMAQTQASGTVTDQQGEPMIGVTVHVKGNTTTGTITDIDGKFSRCPRVARWLFPMWDTKRKNYRPRLG